MNYTRNGIKFTVETSPDYEARPNDFDCYTPRQIAAYEADEWNFVVVSVELHDETEYLGGVESGHYLMTDEDDIGDERVWLSPEEDSTILDDMCDELVARLAADTEKRVTQYNDYLGMVRA